jgi:hypothetical protein
MEVASEYRRASSNVPCHFSQRIIHAADSDADLAKRHVSLPVDMDPIWYLFFRRQTANARVPLPQL